MRIERKAPPPLIKHKRNRMKLFISISCIVLCSLVLAKLLVFSTISSGSNSPVPSSSTVDVGLESNETDINNKHTSGRAISYYKYPRLFVDKVVNCYKDDKCRIFYHHVQKTGGTFLCDLLSPYFNNGENYDASIWCCFGGFMDKFRKNPASYCNRGNFNFLPFEVFGDQMKEVINTCLGLGQTNLTRIVGISSYRQPLQRFVSNIHQFCNMGGCKKNNNTACERACSNCHFVEEGEDNNFWMEWIEHNNRVYREQLHILSDTKSIPPAAQMLMIEDGELTEMTNQLQLSMGRNFSKTGSHNKFHKGQCNFRPPMSMVKLLKSCDDAYKELIRVTQSY